MEVFIVVFFIRFFIFSSFASVGRCEETDVFVRFKFVLEGLSRLDLDISTRK